MFGSSLKTKQEQRETFEEAKKSGIRLWYRRKLPPNVEVENFGNFLGFTDKNGKFGIPAYLAALRLIMVKLPNELLENPRANADQKFVDAARRTLVSEIVALASAKIPLQIVWDQWFKEAMQGQSGMQPGMTDPVRPKVNYERAINDIKGALRNIEGWERNPQAQQRLKNEVETLYKDVYNRLKQVQQSDWKTKFEAPIPTCKNYVMKALDKGLQPSTNHEIETVPHLTRSTRWSRLKVPNFPIPNLRWSRRGAFLQTRVVHAPGPEYSSVGIYGDTKGGRKSMFACSGRKKGIVASVIIGGSIALYLVEQKYNVISKQKYNAISQIIRRVNGNAKQGTVEATGKKKTNQDHPVGKGQTAKSFVAPGFLKKKTEQKSGNLRGSKKGCARASKEGCSGFLQNP